ncbi:MAG: hypothetical protein U9Q40_11590 [Campylobacterota bacterium]|nr:hypothetical protein [Campylobacterota bacterium]
MSNDCKKCDAVYHTKVKGWDSKKVSCVCPFCGSVEKVMFRGDSDA